MKFTKIVAVLIAVILMMAFASCTNGNQTVVPTVKPDGYFSDATGAPENTSETDATPGENPTEVPTPEPTVPPTVAPTEVPTEAPIDTESKLLIPYVKKGLVALYEGNYNTFAGQDKESVVWQDITGNGNDITDIVLGEKCSWNDDGLYVDAQKIALPDSIPELINSDEYTVEFCIKDLIVDGYDFATFLNSDMNDNFALFIRVNNDALEFKCNNAIGNRPTMVGDAKELCETCTIAVTFSSYDVIELYLNGELMDTKEAPANTAMEGDFFIGHPSGQKAYRATVTGMRFYNRVLTESELAANHAALGSVRVNPDYAG